MTDIILGMGGTIDKYEGDAFIAFWNAPAKALVFLKHKPKKIRHAEVNRKNAGHLLSIRLRIGTVSGIVQKNRNLTVTSESKVNKRIVC
ncbi:MAG: hypothetical protein M0P01_09055 [Treponema sp.]|nr:hypothetical protein [Treponema sp.]